jgi:hypothetical protein
MTTIPEAFDAFDENLFLDPAERAKARDCHNEIGEILDGLKYTEGRFLQGSFARKTMVKPLRDIDMVVLLHPNMERFLGAQRSSGAGRLGSAGGPAAVMRDLAKALQPHYPNAKIDPGKHALTMDFGDGGFKFDVVPAFDTKAGDRADVLIANSYTGTWDRSNTRKLIGVVADRNQSCNGRFIHQVRMLKHAVSKSEVLSPFFFGLLSESAVYAAVTSSMPHAEALAAAVAAGKRLLAGGVLCDPTGVDNLLAKLAPNEIQAAKAEFDRWDRAAQEALRLDADGDAASAIEVWNGVFGEAFPTTPARSTLGAAKAWQVGAATSTGRISTSTAGRTVATPGRSWRTH